MKSSFDTSLSESCNKVPLPLILFVNFADDCGIAMKGGKPAFDDIELAVTFDDGRASASTIPTGGIAAIIGSFGIAPATAIICGCREPKNYLNYRDEQIQSATVNIIKI